MADELNVDLGDRVTIEPIKGLRHPREVLISQITDSFMGLGVYADLEYASHLVGEEYAMTGAQLLTNNALRGRLYQQLKKLPQP